MLRNHDIAERKKEVVMLQDSKNSTKNQDKRPQPLSVLEDSIPADLKNLPNWVIWYYHFRHGKFTKVPYVVPFSDLMSPRFKRASVSDPETWRSFDMATEVYKTKTVDGIGFVLTPPFCGIDIDDCRDPETGEITQFGWSVILRVRSYTEVSPSRTGIRIILKASLPVTGRGKTRNRNDSLGIELYERDRYLTITGHRVEGTPETIEDRQEELNLLHAELFPVDRPREASAAPAPLPASLADDRIIELASSAANRDKFLGLWRGKESDLILFGYERNGQADHSRADQALCHILAFYTRCPEQIERLFRRSGLHRDKWDRADYRERTINNALETVTTSYAGDLDLGQVPSVDSIIRPVKDSYLPMSITIGTAEVNNSRLSDDDAAIFATLTDPDQEAPDESLTLETDIQRKLIAQFLTSRDFLKRHGGQVKPAHWTEETHQHIWRVLADYHQRYDACPSKEAIKNELRRNLVPVPGDDTRAVVYLLTLGELNVCLDYFRVHAEDEPAYLADQLTLCFKRNAAKEALAAILTDLKKGNANLAGRFAEAAANLSSFDGPATGRIRIFTRSELEHLPSPYFLVANHVPASAFGLVYGQYGVLKSFLALDMALSIATGTDFLQLFQTRPGKVVYVAAEGHYGIRKRIAAWEKDRGIMASDDAFALIPDAFSLLADEDTQEVARIIRGCLGPSIDVIFLDTLARLFGGADENSTMDMNSFVNNAAQLGKLLGAAIVVIHHSGKDSTKKARGAVSLGGACDFMLELDGNPDALRVRCEKQKDFAPFPDYYLAGIKVDLVGDDSLVLRQIEPNLGASKHNSRAVTNVHAEEDKVLRSFIPDYPERITTKNLAEKSGMNRQKVNRVLDRLIATCPDLHRESVGGNKPAEIYRL